MESRIFVSPDSASNFSTVPVAWRADSRRDAVAGMLAALLSLPLAMGLGALAFAPLGAEYVAYGVLAGLYGAGFIGLVAVLAGARGAAIYAPRSLVSFMIASVCAQVIVGAEWLPHGDPETVLAAVFLLLAMAGAFQLAFGGLRLARVVKFIPTPVMAGFQNAAAIIIVLSQLHVLLGLARKPAPGGWWDALGNAKPLSVVVGLVTLVLVFQGPRIAKRVPPLVTGLAGGTALYYALSLAGFGAQLGPVLGRIPVALPDGHQFATIMALTLRAGFLDALPGLLVGAATIAVVASLDVLISAKVVENLTQQRGNSTRELLCIGAANTVAPLLGGVAGSISLSATTAAVKSGGRSSLTLFVHGVLFLLLVPLLAPALGSIPHVVIGMLVLHAGTQLIDRWTLQLVRRIGTGKAVSWRSIAIDLAVIALVTGVAVAGEVVWAVLIGMAIAVVVFTFRMSRGVVRSMRYGDEVHSRRTRNAGDTELLAAHARAILALELEGPLFFASAEALHNHIDNAIAAKVRHVVLDISRVNELDSTGARILLQAWQRMKGAGVQLAICGHEERAQVEALLRDHHITDTVGAERLFPDLDRALEWCENALLANLKSGGASALDHPFELLDVARGLDATERDALQAALEQREYAAGATVFRQGDVEDTLYLIVRGSASVRMRDARGRERRLVTFSSGTLFGEMALLDRQARSATVVADEPLACYVLERAAFERLAAERPRIGLVLLANIGRELSLRMRRANLSLAEA